MTHVKQKCDFCSKPACYDAKSVLGPWAYMCNDHFKRLALRTPGTYTSLETEVVTNKTCIICGKEKPVGQFYAYHDARGVLRYRNECKKCNLAARKVQRFKKG